MSHLTASLHRLSVKIYRHAKNGAKNSLSNCLYYVLFDYFYRQHWFLPDGKSFADFKVQIFTVRFAVRLERIRR